MKKILGILGLLAVICLFTAIASDRFLLADNIENLVHRTALFGILSVGVAFVIITGGIDLSIGSVVCLVGVLLPLMVMGHGVWPPIAVVAVLGLAVLLGLIHGLLITKMRLPPFIVTLCGLLIYRGLARGITADQAQGFVLSHKELRSIATAKLPIFGGVGPNYFELPVTFLMFVIVIVVAAIFLNQTIFGRYLLALGRNETAARYSGIKTDRMIILAYVICAACAGFGGMLFILYYNDAQPTDFGNFYELYAIAAAVLGGCSLRGGEGSITGVAIGAAVMVVLSNMINLCFPRYQNIEFAIIGAVILIGVIADELVKRLVAARRARRPAE